MTSVADLVYTGKGALIWMPDLRAWARDAARLLRPSGHLFVHEAHPAGPLWTCDEDKPRIRPDRGYFDRSHINDTFPAHGAVKWQAPLGEIINAVISAGLEVQHVAEYAEPFWRPDNVTRQRGEDNCRTRSRLSHNERIPPPPPGSGSKPSGQAAAGQTRPEQSAARRRGGGTASRGNESLMRNPDEKSVRIGRKRPGRSTPQ